MIELRAQSVDRAHHGRSLKWKCERVTERVTERNNKETENNGNMKECQRMNGNTQERTGMHRKGVTWMVHDKKM